MKNILISGIAATMLSLSVSANATPFSYIDYSVGTINYPGTSSNGDYSALSLSFETQVVPFILVESSDYDDNDELAVGAGTFGELGSYTSIFGIVHYVSDDNDDDEVRLTAGIRSTLTDRLEFTAKVRNDITEDDSDNVFKYSLGYYFSERLSVAGNYEVFENLDVLSVSGRFSF